MTARESVEAKAARYLREGRLTVVRRDGDLVVATCDGANGSVYRLGHAPDRPGAWPCSCPATGRCAHTVALMLVVVPRRAATATTSKETAS